MSARAIQHGFDREPAGWVPWVGWGARYLRGEPVRSKTVARSRAQHAAGSADWALSQGADDAQAIDEARRRLAPLADAAGGAP